MYPGLYQQDKPHGWENDLTVTTAAQVFFPPNTLVRKVWVQVISGDVRWTPDGSTPTSTRGGLIPAGDIAIFEFDYPTLSRVKMVAVGASAVISVGYFGI